MVHYLLIVIVYPLVMQLVMASPRPVQCSPASLCVMSPGAEKFESDRYVTAGVSGLETHTYNT